jgi:hypothetical protein
MELFHWPTVRSGNPLQFSIRINGNRMPNQFKFVGVRMVIPVGVRFAEVEIMFRCKPLD